jgi:hypothetical protein
MLTDDDVYVPPIKHTWEYILYGSNIVLVLWELYVIVRCIIE